MRSAYFIGMWGTGLLLGAAIAGAAPIVEDLVAFRAQNSANSNERATGDRIRVGANNVDPATTSFGFAAQCPAGAVCDSILDPDQVVHSLFYRSLTLRPNQYFATFPYDPSRTGPWTLVVSSDPNFAPGTNTVVTTPAIGSVGLMPFVQSLSVRGAGLTPTVSWTLPTTGPRIDRVQFRIFDRDNPVPAIPRGGVASSLSLSPERTEFEQSNWIFDKKLADAATSYTISPGAISDIKPIPLALVFGKHYSMSIVLDHRSGGNVNSRSQSFFDFTPISLPGSPEIFLPTMTPVATTSGLIAPGLYKFSEVPPRLTKLLSLIQLQRRDTSTGRVPAIQTSRA